MRKERIAFDFDGVLTKFPPLIGFLARQLNSEQYPKWLCRIYFNYTVRKLPVKLNRKRLEVLRSKKKNFKFYVISGRIDTHIVVRALKEYKDIFQGIYCRGWPTESKEWVFKEEIAKALKIDYFFDDCLHTICYLRKKGIKAVRI